MTSLPASTPSLPSLMHSLFGSASEGEEAQKHAALVSDCVQDTPLSLETVQGFLNAGIAQDVLADQAQKRRTAYAVIVALLAPISVFSLACETLPAWSTRFDVKIACIILQLVLTGLALFSIKSGWATSWTHNAWLPARLRAELLRRELFLYLARLGPYLDATDAGTLAAHADSRIREITTRMPRQSLTNQEVTLLELLALEPMPIEGPGVDSWRDNLEDSYRTQPETFADCLKPSLITLYLDCRLEDQRRYYQRKHKQHSELDERYDGLSTWAIGAAFVVTVLDLALTIREHMVAETAEPSAPLILLTNLVWLLAPFLPTLGVFFITLRSFFENHRLSRSYADQLPTLQRLETHLSDLYPSPVEKFLPGETAFHLRRLVLRTETLLSDELRRWWHILEPERPHG